MARCSISIRFLRPDDRPATTSVCATFCRLTKTWAYFVCNLLDKAIALPTKLISYWVGPPVALEVRGIWVNIHTRQYIPWWAGLIRKKQFAYICLVLQQWIGKVWINLLCTPEVNRWKLESHTHTQRRDGFHPSVRFQLQHQVLVQVEVEGFAGNVFLRKSPHLAFGIPFRHSLGRLGLDDLSMTNLQNRLLCLCLSIWLADTSLLALTLEHSPWSLVLLVPIQLPSPISQFPVGGVNIETGFVYRRHTYRTFCVISCLDSLFSRWDLGASWMKGKAVGLWADKRKLPVVSPRIFYLHFVSGNKRLSLNWDSNQTLRCASRRFPGESGWKCPFWTSHSHYLPKSPPFILWGISLIEGDCLSLNSIPGGHAFALYLQLEKYSR